MCATPSSTSLTSKKWIAFRTWRLDWWGPRGRRAGKLPTDTWWHTIVPTNGKERTGYPTQKPLGIVRRIVQASSKPGDLVLDFFAGSGTLGGSRLRAWPAIRAD